MNNENRTNQSLEYRAKILHIKRALNLYIREEEISIQYSNLFLNLKKVKRI